MILNAGSGIALPINQVCNPYRPSIEWDDQNNNEMERGKKKKKHGRYSCCDTANKNIDFIIFPPVAFFFFYFSREKGKTFSLFSPRSDFLGSGRRSNVSGEKVHSKKIFWLLSTLGWMGWMDGWMASTIDAMREAQLVPAQPQPEMTAAGRLSKWLVVVVQPSRRNARRRE